MLILFRCGLSAMSKPSSVAWMAISLSLHRKWDVMFLFPSGSIKDQSDLQNLHSCVELIRAKSHLHGNISVTIFLAVARIALPKKNCDWLGFPTKTNSRKWAQRQIYLKHRKYGPNPHQVSKNTHISSSHELHIFNCSSNLSMDNKNFERVAFGLCFKIHKTASKNMKSLKFPIWFKYSFSATHTYWQC